MPPAVPKVSEPKTKAPKPTGPEQVAAFMTNLEHPLKPEIAYVREIIITSDSRLTEHIKWNAPSFCLNGDDRITLNLAGKDFFRLVFHCGAKVKAQAAVTRLFEDETGLLEWASNDRAILQFSSQEDVTAKKESLTWLVKKWLETSAS